MLLSRNPYVRYDGWQPGSVTDCRMGWGVALMNAAQFDALLRKLGTGSRRGVIAGLGTAGLSALLALFGVDHAEARNKKKGKRRKKKKQTSTPSGPIGQSPPPGCRSLQQTCSGDCCSGLTCGDTGCTPGKACCREPRATCADNCDCCGEAFVCDTNNLFETACCGNEGAPCDGDTVKCCFPYECSGEGGTCFCPRVCPDETCAPREGCCSNDECSDGRVCLEGRCSCPSGEIACGGDCCVEGAEVCKLEIIDGAQQETCQPGSCPDTAFCAGFPVYSCGQECACVTAIDLETTVCATVGRNFNKVVCADCETNAECTTLLQQEAVCVAGGVLCTSFCPGNFCVPSTC